MLIGQSARLGAEKKRYMVLVAYGDEVPGKLAGISNRLPVRTSARGGSNYVLEPLERIFDPVVNLDAKDKVFGMVRGRLQDTGKIASGRIYREDPRNAHVLGRSNRRAYIFRVVGLVEHNGYMFKVDFHYL
jgi:hypothetical protein